MVVNQLGKIEQALKDDCLIRCHRSYMVNLRAVEGFDEAYLFLGKKSIPVSKTHRSTLMGRLRVL